MNEVVKIEFTYQEEFVINFAKTYANDVELGERMIADSPPLRWCLLDAYHWMMRNRGMAKYETLDEEPIKGLQVCTCLWLLNFVFEKYFV